MELATLCSLFLLGVFVYGYSIPRIKTARYLDRLARKWESNPNTVVMFEYPNGKHVKCEFTIETDEAGYSIIVAKPVDEEITQ